MQTLTLGDVTIQRVVEIGRSSYPTAKMLPDSTADAIAKHRSWLAPFWDQTTDDMGSRIQTWVVRTPEHVVLVDTGVGNGKHRAENALWHMRDGGFLADLATAGVKPDQVDYVLCTHLHVDHVGWNTVPREGGWVPTFPKARYVFAGEEWAYWKHEHDAGREPSGCVGDSVVPVVEAGQADFVSGTHRLGRWLSFEPTVGHTPGHVAVRLTTKAGEAVFAGDLMHRVIQVAEPQWSSQFCADPAQAARTRTAFVERCAASGDLVLAAHFPHPGRVVRTAAGHRFEPVALDPIGAG